jgi:hypothetical protein
LGDYGWTPEYTKEQYISEEFEYFKQRMDSSCDYDKISEDIIDMLCNEYRRLNKTCDESMKVELYRDFLNDELDFFNEEFVYSIKEFIAIETSKPSKERLNFINERKVLENNVSTSFTENVLHVNENQNQKKVRLEWYEPKSKEDLFDVLDFNGCFSSSIITEDVNNFDQYLYAFEIFEETDFYLAINDRVGDFESRFLPRIREFLDKEDVVLKGKDYLEQLIS